MKCPRCGYENPPNAQLCEKCRYPLFAEPISQSSRCPRCGYENPPNAQLCEKCRYPLFVPVVKVEERKEQVPPEVLQGMTSLRLFSSYYVLAFLIFQASISILDISRPIAEGVAVASEALMISSMMNLYRAINFLIRRDKGVLNRAGVIISVFSTFLVGAGGYFILPYVKSNETVNLITDKEVIVGSILFISGIAGFLVGNIISVVSTQFKLSREFGPQFKRAGEFFLISFVLGALTFVIPFMELVSFLVLLYASYTLTDASVKASNKR
ncbi:zinc ribbon domain-containing protein [Sulfuracidifex tepidarius]|uniref:RanBP2-type domain-containing protein n=1 Tax=Sulfuracidifex tepidarius TaxID=1294262 RepID=A0A510DS69_9CREN|nr:zinc ribbon domain-containing protein [Sulfuracidifex tepidarius]BBG23013.1 hypothetical protein IC006_0297 [Sulfuracidifex tepidarius]BBG25775.1 hypothetical protein IC007_0280 [Sulfuracidifex tepidarius]